MVLLIPLQNNTISAKQPLWEQFVVSAKTPAKHVKTLQSCLGKTTHPKPIILGTSAARQEEIGLGQRYKQAGLGENIKFSSEISASRPQQLTHKAIIQANICLLGQTGSS